MFNIPCRVQRCLYLFAKAEGSDPSPGIGYCIQQMTRLERDLQGMLNTLKIGGEPMATRQTCLAMGKKTSPFAGWSVSCNGER